MADLTKTIKTLSELESCGEIVDNSGVRHGMLAISCDTVRDAIELLKEQQQKKGHWQPYEYGNDTWHKCSVCGVADRYIDIIKRDGHPDYRMECIRNFCPHCGADMRSKRR